MKYALGSLLFAGAFALSFGAARADVLVLTSSALKDNDQLAVKNACADKQRSPNCVIRNLALLSLRQQQHRLYRSAPLQPVHDRN
jgi:hypothetical protein